MRRRIDFPRIALICHLQLYRKYPLVNVLNLRRIHYALPTDCTPPASVPRYVRFQTAAEHLMRNKYSKLTILSDFALLDNLCRETSLYEHKLISNDWRPWKLLWAARTADECWITVTPIS